MPAILDLPKRQRSGSFQFSDSERDETLKLLSEAKTGQAVSVTDAFDPANYEPKDNLTADQVARNVVSGRNNTIREALEPHIADGYHVKMHVVATDNGYVGAVSLREGNKPERKERKPAKPRQRQGETDVDYKTRENAWKRELKAFEDARSS